MKTQTDTDALAWIDDRLRELDEDDLRRTRSARTGPQGARIEWAGRTVINFGSNDYLGLAADPRLSRAVAKAIATDGWGSGASPLIAGRSKRHALLERRLAEFMRTEAAIVFSSGFAANLGTIPALVGRGDAIFSDRLNHASLIDGCRLSRARVHIYPHADCRQLEEMLAAAGHYPRRLIVTDGLFSMDGDPAPLVALTRLADRFDCMLMVDEAHAVGVFGDNGCGIAEEQGVADRVDLRVGTMSKSLGSAGGFVAGSKKLIEWLYNRTRSYVFSTAQPAAASAASLAALEIIGERRPQPGRALVERAARLRSQLVDDGWDIGLGRGQIIPVMVGSASDATSLSAALLQRGLFVPAIRPPTVPPGTARLRISLCAGHGDEMIESLVRGLRELGARGHD